MIDDQFVPCKNKQVKAERNNSGGRSSRKNLEVFFFVFGSIGDHNRGSESE